MIRCQQCLFNMTKLTSTGSKSDVIANDLCLCIVTWLLLQTIAELAKLVEGVIWLTSTAAICFIINNSSSSFRGRCCFRRRFRCGGAFDKKRDIILNQGFEPIQDCYSTGTSTSHHMTTKQVSHDSLDTPTTALVDWAPPEAPPLLPEAPPPLFLLEGLVGGLEVTNSLIKDLISSFSSSFKSGKPSRSAAVSIFLVVARAL